MKKLLFVATSLIWLTGNSQITHQWSLSAGSSGSEFAHDVAHDSFGNIYVVGSFQGTVDFDPGIAAVTLSANGTASHGFIAMYNAAGNLVWVNDAGSGNSTSTCDFRSVEIGPGGDIFVTGSFTDSADFEGGPGQTMGYSSGNNDVVMVKYANNGNLIWVKPFGGTSSDNGVAISLDNGVNILIAGNFEGTMDVDPSLGTANMVSAGNADGFFAKYDSSGLLLASGSFGGLGMENVKGITSDFLNNILLSGVFEGLIDVDPGPFLIPLTSGGNSDVFVATLNSTGSLLGFGSFGGLGNENVNGLFLDSALNLYLTGSFEQTVDFDMGPGINNLTATGGGSPEIYILKTDFSYSTIWVQAPGSAGFETGASIEGGFNNKIVVTGFFENAVDFNYGPGVNTLTASSGTDAFFMVLDSSGLFIDAKSIQGFGIESASAVSVSDSGFFYISGNFSDSADFDPAVPNVEKFSNGNADLFTAKYFMNLACNLILTPTGNNPICNAAADGLAMVSASGNQGPLSYLWNTTPNQMNDTAFGLVAGTYSVLVSDSAGCVANASVTLVDPPLVSISFTSTPASCAGVNNGTATATANNTTGPVDFQWAVSPADTFATIDSLAAGYHVLTITDSIGCMATDSVLTGTSGGLVLTLDSTAATCAQLNDGTADVSVTGNTGPLEYQWTTFPVQAIPDSLDSVSGLGAGVAIVMATDSVGCTATDSIMIPVAPPTWSFGVSSISPSCTNGSDGKAMVFFTMGVDTNYTYSWNTTPVQTNDTATGLPAGIYDVTVTDTLGCEYTQSANISDAPPLFVSVSTSPASNGCGNNGLAIASPTGGTGTYSYLWNSIPSQTDDSATSLLAGNYKVVVTDANGCKDSANAVISGNAPAFNYTISTIDPSCFGDTNGIAIASASGSPGPFSYSWNTVPAQVNDSALNLGDGSYTVTITDGACSYVYVADVNEPQPIIPNFITSNLKCKDLLTGIVSVNPSGGTPPFSFLWNTTPPNVTDSLNNLDGGTYVVTITDANACVEIDTATITEPVTRLNATGFSMPASCFGVSDGVAISTTNTGVPPYNITWNSTPVQTNDTATGMPAGTYKLLIQDSAGCVDSVNMDILEPSETVISISSTHASCGVSNGSAVSLVSGGTSPYNYEWSNGVTVSAISNLPPKKYTLVVTDANNCADSNSVIILDNGIGPVISVSQDTSIIAGGQALLMVSGGSNYSWNPSAGLSCSDCAMPLAMPIGSTTYCVTVGDVNGCNSTACINVDVKTVNCGEIFLPNAFSPNEDGNNDKFIIRGGCFSDVNFAIFNRVGQKVFETTDSTMGWDGLYEDQQVEPDVFMWVLKGVLINGAEINLTGNVSLIR